MYTVCIVSQFAAKRANEAVIRKVADNRREQEQVIQNFIQPCPTQLCEGAAYIEHYNVSIYHFQEYSHYSV